MKNQSVLYNISMFDLGVFNIDLNSNCFQYCVSLYFVVFSYLHDHTMLFYNKLSGQIKSAMATAIFKKLKLHTFVFVYKNSLATLKVSPFQT